MLPFPPLGSLPDPGIEFTSLVSPALAGRFFTTELPGKHSVIGSHAEVFFFFWLCYMACGILVPDQGLNPGHSSETTEC